jgi:hypothetical protein
MGLLLTGASEPSGFDSQHSHGGSMSFSNFATSLGLFLGCCIFSATVYAAPDDPLDFTHEIVPLLRRHCGKCHTGARKQGGFSFDTRRSLLLGGESGAAVKLGDSSQSALIERITSRDADLQMPPEGPRLSDAEVALIRRWIDSGLVWDDGFAFAKSNYEAPLLPRQVALPPARPGRDNPIDRLVDAHPNQPAPRAGISDREFARRVSLDLTGLLPTPEQLHEFLSNPPTTRRQKFIDDLLDNPIAYADHWLTFWNDLLRNDYTGTGFITGGRKQITSWLHASLVANKPYDVMVRELISPTAESEGFIQGIRWRGEVSASQTNEIQFAQSISQAFLGINMKCASCHDSFIDRWKLQEAYGLAAIYADAPLPIFRCDKPTGEVAQPSWLFPELGQVDPQAPKPQRLQQLANLLTHPQNGRLSRSIVNRLWHRLMGLGLVHPVDALNTEPRDADLLDYLAWDFSQHGYNLKHTLRLIATSATYQQQIPVEASPDGEHWQDLSPIPRRLTAEQFVDAVWQLTGSQPAKADAVVARRTESRNAGPRPQARWIWTTDQKQAAAPGGESATFEVSFNLPALPEVAAAALTCDNDYVLTVNGRRIAADGNWETVEIVSLADSLRVGKNTIRIVAKNGGEGPNPAGLLFVGQIRMSDQPPLTMATGPEWRWTRQMPDGEGNFAAEPADWQPAAVLTEPTVWAGRIGETPWQGVEEALDPQRARVRAALVKADELMRALGRPNRDQIVTSRPTQFTTLEALELANGESLKAMLESGAQRLAKRFAERPAELVEWLYTFGTSHPPSEQSREAALRFLGTTPQAPEVEDLLWSLVLQPDFLHVR